MCIDLWPDWALSDSPTPLGVKMTVMQNISIGSVSVRMLALTILTLVGVAAASGAEKTIYAFRGGGKGAQPIGPLIADGAGNFLGMTGGGGNQACESGCGTIFKLSSKGKESIVYAFQGGDDGGYPTGGLVADGSGNLYGTTRSFGANHYGTIFKVTPGGAETVLYAFQGGSDGWGASQLILDNLAIYMVRQRKVEASRVPIARHRGVVQFSSYNQMGKRSYFIYSKAERTVTGPWRASSRRRGQSFWHDIWRRRNGLWWGWLRHDF